MWLLVMYKTGAITYRRLIVSGVTKFVNRETSEIIDVVIVIHHLVHQITRDQNVIDETELTE